MGDHVDVADAHETDLHGSVKLRQIGRVFLVRETCLQPGVATALRSRLLAP
jgi:hypothetical protein